MSDELERLRAGVQALVDDAHMEDAASWYWRQALDALLAPTDDTGYSGWHECVVWGKGYSAGFSDCQTGALTPNPYPIPTEADAD